MTQAGAAAPCSTPVPPQDAFARGEVFIGSRESGYTVLDGLPPSTQGHHWPHGITIVTPERRFLLACETESEQRAWMEALRKVVDRPMLPQEYAGEAGGPAEGEAWRPHVAVTLQGPVLLQWKPTSSTSPSTRRSRRPEDSGLPRRGCRRPRLTGPELQPRAPVSLEPLCGLAHPPWDTHSPPTDLWLTANPGQHTESTLVPSAIIANR